MNELRQRYHNLIKSMLEYLHENRYRDPFPVIIGNPQKVYLPEILSRDTKKTEYKKAGNHPMEENVLCNLCENRFYAIKKYLKKPVKEELKILLLNYSGSLDPNTLPKDLSDKYYFSSSEEDEVFNGLLKKFGFSLDNFYFQEFVACHFSPNSSQEEWNARVKNCLGFLEKTIMNYQIQKLVVIGNAALLLFGNEARELASRHRVMTFQIGDYFLPLVVIRSPLSLISIRKKRNDFEKKLRNFPEEWNIYTHENDTTKTLQSIEDSLPKPKTKTVEIEKVTLVPASQIKSDRDIEKEIKKHFGDKKLLLYKTLKLKKEEIDVEKQITASLTLILENVQSS